MEQTPLAPLVSDEDVKRIRNAKFSESVPIFEVRDLYEADRLKTREVVQALVNITAELRCKEGCRKYEPGGTAPLCYQCGERHRILALAKSTLNIEPSKP